MVRRDPSPLDNRARFDHGWPMIAFPQAQPAASPLLAWTIAAFAGIAAPIGAMLALAEASANGAFAAIVAAAVSVGMMGAGIIGAAASGRFAIGVVLGCVCGAGLLLLAAVMGVPSLAHAFALAFGVVIACVSFAARGFLFSRSAPGAGWWIAVFVVSGEAAILATAAAMPGALPDWLLALLPAQWANLAIGAALADGGTGAAIFPLVALGGTAAATLFAALLLPRRWPYLIMFTTWLAMSALVYHSPIHGP